MMLKENITQDIKKAMQEKNALLLSVLRGVIAVVKNREIEKKKELDEDEIIQVISSEAKKRKDSIEQFEKGGRQDLVEKEKQELEILQKYLPEQMSENDIKKEVELAIKESGAVNPSDTGKVMSILMPKLKGKAEGSLVSKMVGELLK
ncbi:GatB/YqeY domain-containing protein [Patescibacteria group bacterium]|nr:GatB/YqeY domain-containing protein [Patescibacteria group bacterium]